MKVLLIGLDGVGPQLLKWAKENKLPNTAKLINAGAYGKLKSTMPPLSFPAWPSFYTGMNPGKHGVFDSLQLTNEGFKTVSFKSVTGKSLWRIMSEDGKKVIVMAVPMTYPPETVNGILISGMDTPSEKVNFTYPNNLKEKLEKEGYRIYVNRKLYQYPEALFKEAIELMWKKGEIAIKLMKDNDWDFCMLALNETDVVAHFLPEKVFECYREADKIMGKFIAEIDKETNIVLMSDHGNIPFQGSLYLSSILQQEIKQEVRTRDKITRLLSLLLSKARIEGMRYNDKKGVYCTGGGAVYVFDKAIKEQVFNKLYEFSKQYDFKIYKREEIYFGEFLDKAPDFVIFSEKYIPQSGYSPKAIVGPPKRPGWHSLYGIIAISGKDIQNTEVKNTEITDLAPTILHLMGLPIPREMDGRVLKEIFNKESELYKKPISYQEVGEEAKVKRKIKELKSRGKI